MNIFDSGDTDLIWVLWPQNIDPVIAFVERIMSDPEWHNGSLQV